MIPFTLLAFFPSYRMSEARAPTLDEMLGACRAVRKQGLRRIRLGNLGIFARTRAERERLQQEVTSQPATRGHPPPRSPRSPRGSRLPLPRGCRPARRGAMSRIL